MDLRQEWYSHEIKDTESETYHRPLDEEDAFWYAVRTGNLDFVRKNCEQQRFSETSGVGVLSRDETTNLKYHMVVTAAMTTRACVKSGMESEQAFRLCDFYIQKLDNIFTPQEVVALHDQMVLDFTDKMRVLLQRPETSKAVTDCIEYIYTHIHERITVDSMACYTGLSSSHLSRLFKKEMGVPIGDYIREKKVEKAKELLHFSDFTLIEISNYLAFSSQSHFTKIFQEQTGMTPKKYRDRYWKDASGADLPED